MISRLPAVLNHLKFEQPFEFTLIHFHFISFSPLASIIRNDFNVNFLQNIWHCRCTMSNSSPTSDRCHFSNQFHCRWWQTNRKNVLLKFHIAVELHQGNVVLEITRWVVWMNFFALYQIFLVWQSFILIFHVVLAQANFKIRVWSCGNAVCWNYSMRLILTGIELKVLWWNWSFEKHEFSKGTTVFKNLNNFFVWF